VTTLAPDFCDMLVVLHDAGAEFLLVGGHAVAFHGHPRATKDMDILVRPDPENARRVYRSLAAFGVPLADFEVDAQDFTAQGKGVQIGLPPYRIDILTSIDGVTFEEAMEGHDVFELEGRNIPVIARHALIRNKRASGRPQDLADVHALEHRDR
jgi:hypothetical protein